MTNVTLGTQSKPILVATYGTLIRGESNHGSMERAGGEFVSAGKTVDNYDIFKYCGGFPSVSLAHSNNNKPVTVEVFRVDEKGLKGALDCLEGTRYPPHHSDNMYNRTVVPIRLTDGQVVDAWIYHIDEDLGEDLLIKGGSWVNRNGVNNA